MKKHPLISVIVVPTLLASVAVAQITGGVSYCVGLMYLPLLLSRTCYTRKKSDLHAIIASNHLWCRTRSTSIRST